VLVLREVVFLLMLESAALVSIKSTSTVLRLSTNMKTHGNLSIEGVFVGSNEV